MSSNEQQDVKNLTRRKVLTAATGVVGAAGATFLAVPFVSSWQPSEKAKAAGAPVEADLSQMQPGQMLTVSWRGKPVWIVKRTSRMLELLPTLNANLRDPQSESSDQPAYCKNTFRSTKEEYLVVIGICTHLGCAPLYRPAEKSADMGDDWKGGFFCPCHGSTYDLAGRVFQGVPAPKNLEIPPYRYLSDSVIRIGEDPEEGVA
ncbi:MAG: ubiquinol-cytochrome c reductase iron-sulfur subunit [Piscirickettsiaceae bacterium CG_4_9_14_3_um_filter_43_564]|nr:ubiquinol-cytochrome c reductase iron-sulfur subunit [Thiomicrospira sp.]OIP95533.1 MAG: ubiquinol-cytochrome c reductase iron-sulfur subunit [Thiomicrospira sp. CG2_30_44_34]PIQ03717.1 MAG: ubiquinol-cytochrome c reductase iron-sulfur subunit [Piscirickettsiaceae bacterium CG18_big_fil_WC_8_21_14_2_50_44_103]PIU39057.1 MAG: ubiquinol-cytochrome c reductase iron-sulfur subunit [Piscirickettsiaceae bacterium CG07_land_8_20_14_0_80_44_28]PIW57020.1 MAG: ubiquinol-cytochrome c reductase iron-su